MAFKYKNIDGTWSDINTTFASKINWGKINGTLSDQTDLQTTLDTKANTSDLIWTRYYIASTSTRASFSLYKSNNTLIIHAQDFWYTCEASTQFTAGSISSYIPSGKKIPGRIQTCIANVSGASFGSVWVNTSNNLILYSTIANPSYINFELVIPLVNS